MLNSNIKEKIILISYGIILFFSIMNLSSIMGFAMKWLKVLTPFIYGFIIAYLINWPYEFFVNKVYGRYLNEGNKKIINAVSIFSAYLCLFGACAFLLIIIIPEMVESISQFISNFPQYIESFSIFIDSLSEKFNLIILSPEQTDKFLDGFMSNVQKFTNRLVPSVYRFTKSFTVGVYNWIIGIIISFYLIGSKDKLLKQFHIFLNACFPKKCIDKFYKIMNLSHDTFGKFISGKILDSLIIGVLCFIGMKILNIPYDLVISVTVGITNIIPFFGPFIGAIPSILVLLLVNPIKALWFTIFVLILQQIDGNIIGPKVLGNSVGISGLWIMFSVIIGGGLFGVPGMILGVPVFAVIYAMVREKILEKNSNKV